MKEAVLAAKAYAPFVRKIEVEVENMDMVREAVEAGADIIMLDNMSHEQMAEAVAYIDGRAETECSGNITKENVKAITSKKFLPGLLKWQEFLSKQGRFAHMFKPGNEWTIEETQKYVDKKWEELLYKCSRNA